MMNDHYISESKKMVKSEQSVHDRRGMAAQVPEYNSLWFG